MIALLRRSLSASNAVTIDAVSIPAPGRSACVVESHSSIIYEQIGKSEEQWANHQNHFRLFGQRLAAALISYQLGRPTVDGTLNQYVGGNLDPWWEETALSIYKDVMRRRDIHPLAPPEGDHS
jgi:hypothetical protein